MQYSYPFLAHSPAFKTIETPRSDVQASRLFKGGQRYVERVEAEIGTDTRPKQITMGRADSGKA
jgi:hypothetical protein